MIPAIHAKTTALFIDDNREFLDDLNDFLPKSHFFKFITNPLEALEEVKAHTRRSFTSTTLYDFGSTRFDEVLSVIVVDHRMKPIDGLEFCQRLGATSAKRIMLTSHASKDLAIKALNNKLIDAFFLKIEDNIINELSLAMHKCTVDFFNNLSTNIDGFKSRYNPLANEDFAKFFINFCQEKNIQSYSCFHDFYNIVLKDKNEQEIFMTLYNDEYIDDLLASEQARSAQKQLIDLIKNKQAAPCFKDIDNPLIPKGALWEEFMVPLTRLSNDLAIAIG